MPKFQKGQSGNPSGRPKIAEEFRKRALKLVDEKVLAAWEDEIELRPREVITQAGPFEMVSRGKEWMRASELIAAYALGKPAQAVEVSGPEGGPVRVDVRELSDADLARIAAGGAK